MILRFLSQLLGKKSPPSAPASSNPTEQHGGVPDTRVQVAELQGIVYDLLSEVEALRETILQSSLGRGGAESPYGRAYREAMFLNHHEGGCIPAPMKVMRQFYDWSDGNLEHTLLALNMSRQSLRIARRSGPKSSLEPWRECLFMKRLGYTEREIEEYKREAEQAHTYT